MDEIKFHVAAAFDQLCLPLFLSPDLVHVPPDDPRINIAERAAYILRECKIGLPISGVEIVIKDTANASCLVAVGQVEIVIAPGFELGIISFFIEACVMCLTGTLERAMKVLGIRVDVEHWREIASTAKPLRLRVHASSSPPAWLPRWW